mmetsp:Transcript_16193/g.40843  ORF Transcript_16193/g.40843 Transcript_16193/m.40843 type:complete len:100 (+) Transcript_16193:498-797(+)
MGFSNSKTRDTWLFKLLHSWRPTVSAQRLAIVIVDEATDTMIGQGKMTVFAVDKPDPDKFKIKTFVALDTGGKVRRPQPPRPEPWRSDSRVRSCRHGAR